VRHGVEVEFADFLLVGFGPHSINQSSESPDRSIRALYAKLGHPPVPISLREIITAAFRIDGLRVCVWVRTEAPGSTGAPEIDDSLFKVDLYSLDGLPVGKAAESLAGTFAQGLTSADKPVTEKRNR
jgi:hypothetical protein